jgi:hypothetical protein
LMRICAILFLGAGIAFAAVPDYILQYITRVGSGLFGWYAPPPHLGGERFWLVLAVTHVFILAYLCALVQRNLLRYISYARPVILSKFISATGFFLCLVLDERQFFYLVGGIVDGLIFLFTWRFYARAIKSRA